MYVKRKRFVRQKEDLLEERTARLLLHLVAPATVLIIVVFLFASLGAFMIAKPYVSIRLDPDVYTQLSDKGYAEVYIASTAPLSVKASKVWIFGKLRIYKAVVYSKSDVDALLSTQGVISIYSEKRLSPAVVLNISTSGYDLGKDIDNLFHKATGAWTGRGVTVAIIDTGIDYTHPDFFDENGKSIIKLLVSVLYVTQTQSYIVWGFDQNGSVDKLLSFDKELWNEYGETAFLDINGHGTHVAGIIAGRGWASNGMYRGIAPGSNLVVVKAFNKDGASSIDLCLAALQWVYNYGKLYNISILSLSWGAYFASDGSDPLSLAVDSIVLDKGIWVFAAAGNGGNYPNAIAVPGVAKHAITVGAWDAYHDKLAWFSSLGPTVDNRMKPDFVASGVMVVSAKSRYANINPTVGGYYVALSGTSMATPTVAGLAANFIEYYRAYHRKEPTLQDFVNWMSANGRRINIFYKDFITGWGIPYSPR
jgi:subtilisin family serine protease